MNIMNTRTINWTILLVSLAIVTGALIPIISFDCWGSMSTIESFLCSGFYEDKIEPLLWSFLPLLAVSFILLFFKREVFIAWAKFGAPTFVVMLAVIYYTYNNAPASGGWVNWGSDEQVASVLLPILYVAISLGIIIYRRFAKKSGKPV